MGTNKDIVLLPSFYIFTLHRTGKVVYGHAHPNWEINYELLLEEDASYYGCAGHACLRSCAENDETLPLCAERAICTIQEKSTASGLAKCIGHMHCTHREGDMSDQQQQR